MAISISKRSLLQFPQESTQLIPDHVPHGTFNHYLLNESEYLVKYYDRPYLIRPLSPEMIYNSQELTEAIFIVKTALFYIGFNDEAFSSEFNLAGYFGSKDIFNEILGQPYYSNELKTIILLYKSIYGLGTSPLIDHAFLKHLDEKLIAAKSNLSWKVTTYTQSNGTNSYPVRKYEFIGQTKGDFITISGEESGSGEYKYTIGTISKDSQLDVFLDKPKIQLELIDVPFSDPEELPVTKIPQELGAKIDEYEGEFETNANAITVSQSYTVLTGILSPKNPDDYILYEIKPGDTYESILLEHYYGVGNDQTFKDENGNVLLYYPVQNMLSPTNRDYDFKLKFYMNHIHHYNVIENEGVFVDYGIISPPDSALTDDELDAYFNYEVEFDPEDPETVRLNTDRFIEYKKTINPNSELTFNEFGSQTYYTLVTGSIIKLPKRKVIDPLFYHLNFRPEFMLHETESGYEYIEDPSLWDEIMDTIDEALDAVVEFVEEVKEAIREFYNAIRQYFIDLYNDYIEYLKLTWPRGWGGYLNPSIGITWGIPLGTDLVFNNRIYRKVENQTEFTLNLFQSTEFSAYLDLGIGYNVGLKSGSGRKRKNAGLTLGAGIQAGVRFYWSSEYEFPIRPEETGLIAAVAAALGPIGTIATGIISAFSDINLDPEQYLAESEFSVSGFIAAYAAAQVGTSSNTPPGGAHPDGDIDSVNKTVAFNRTDSAIDNKTKSWMSNSSIWSKIISGIGIGAEAELNLGYSYKYSAKYDNKPLLARIDARVPSEVETANCFYVKGYLQIGPMGDFLQRLFLNSSIGILFQLLNFDKGLSLNIINKVSRETHVADFDKENIFVNIPSGGIPLEVTDNGGKIKYLTRSVETEVQFNLMTGDYGGFCVLGNEIYITLNTYKLFDTVFDDPSFIFDLDFILSLFKNVGINYKFGYGYNGFDRQVLSNEIIENAVEDGSPTWGQRREILKSAKKQGKDHAFTVDIGLAMGAEVEFNLQLILPIVTYYFTRLMFITDVTEIDEFDEGVIGNNQRKSRVNLILDKESKAKSFYQDEDSKIDHVGFCTEMLNYLHEPGTLTNLNDSDINYGNGVLNSLDPSKLPVIFVEFCKMLFHLDFLVNRPGSDEYLAVHQNNYTGLFNKYLGTQEMLNAFSDLYDCIKVSVYVQGKLGASYGFSISGAAGFAKIRLSLGLDFGYIFHFDIIEDGQLSITDEADPIYILVKKMGGKLNDAKLGLERLFIDWTA